MPTANSSSTGANAQRYACPAGINDTACNTAPTRSWISTAAVNPPMFTTPEAVPERCVALAIRAPSKASVAPPPPAPISTNATTSTGIGSAPGQPTSTVHTSATTQERPKVNRSRRFGRPEMWWAAIHEPPMKPSTPSISSEPTSD